MVVWWKYYDCGIHESQIQYSGGSQPGGAPPGEYRTFFQETSVHFRKEQKILKRKLIKETRETKENYLRYSVSSKESFTKSNKNLKIASLKKQG